MSQIIEIREAIAAGEKALTSLQAAKEQLRKAGNWGIFDLVGGGFFGDIMKHSRMNDATRCMENAKYHLQRFSKELSDVNGYYNLRLDVGGFLSFADFFFDGLVADFLVQSKINDAKKQVDKAITQVEQILANLKRMI